MNEKQEKLRHSAHALQYIWTTALQFGKAMGEDSWTMNEFQKYIALVNMDDYDPEGEKPRLSPEENHRGRQIRGKHPEYKHMRTAELMKEPIWQTYIPRDRRTKE